MNDARTESKGGTGLGFSAVRRGSVTGGSALLLLLLLALGCQTVHVRTDFDPAISFSGLQSFYWLEPPETEGADPFADNSLLRKRLRFAIENSLAGRGYREAANADEADFFATYAVVLEDRIRDQGSSYFGFGSHRRYGYGTGYRSPSISNYQESTLIIDLLDPASEEIIWRGWGSGLIATRDRDRSDERLNRGVQQILKRFPPDAADAD